MTEDEDDCICNGGEQGDGLCYVPHAADCPVGIRQASGTPLAALLTRAATLAIDTLSSDLTALGQDIQKFRDYEVAMGRLTRFQKDRFFDFLHRLNALLSHAATPVPVICERCHKPLSEHDLVNQAQCPITAPPAPSEGLREATS